MALLYCLLLSALTLQHTEAEWEKILGKERYLVMRKKRTERAFSGIYRSEDREGVYHCAACQEPLFKSEDKYMQKNSGWPCFKRPIEPKKVYYLEDRIHSFKRYEVLCSGCHSHLGHVFNDGPPPKHFRYTINSLGLLFQKKN